MADRRPRQWFDSDVFLEDVTVGTPELQQLSVAGDEVRTLTVTRIIADLAWVPAAMANNNTAVLRLTLGIGVATTAAIGAGVASLPSIISNVEFPARGWLYKGVMHIAMHTATGAQGFIQWERRHLDLGAMRKLDNGLLFLVAQAEVVSGTAFVTDLDGHLRFLCLT